MQGLDRRAGRCGSLGPQRLTGEQAVDGIGEIPLRRLRPLLIEIDEAVVDAAVVAQTPLRIEQCCLGRHREPREVDHRELRIAQGDAWQSVLSLVSLDVCCRKARIGIDEAKLHLPRETLRELR